MELWFASTISAAQSPGDGGAGLTTATCRLPAGVAVPWTSTRTRAVPVAPLAAVATTRISCGPAAPGTRTSAANSTAGIFCFGTTVRDASTGGPPSNDTVTVSTTSGSNPPFPVAFPVTRSSAAAVRTASPCGCETVTCVIGFPWPDRYLTGPEAETATVTGTVNSVLWPATIRTEVR